MQSILDDRIPRQVIPRWRPPSRLSGAELQSHKRKLSASSEEFSDYERALRRWQNQKSLINAAELFFATVDTPFLQKSIGAINQLLSSKNVALVEIAASIASLGRASDPEKEVDLRAECHRQIGYLKRRVREYPLDVISLVELSRLYTSIGQRNQAFRAMDIAVKLDSQNRFVLRSASRLFVHFREPDRARKLFERLSTRDPWLLATQIALADVNGWEQRTGKLAREILHSKSLSPEHLTELAAAMSTVELKAGSRKLGRKFAQLVPLAPNENSVAQLRWLAERFNLPFSPMLLNTRWSFEARANFDRAIGNWLSCVQNADRWFWDEPFSVRPLHVATFVEAEVRGDLDSAQKFAELALIANESDATALNNLVFVLALRGRLEDAERIQGRVRHSDGRAAERAVNMATQGMLSFRRGRWEAGVNFYNEAISELSRLKFRGAALNARMHLAIETYRSGAITSEEYRAKRAGIEFDVKASNDQLMAAICDRIMDEEDLMFAHANAEM